MECSQIFHDYFTIYRIRVFWNVRQIKFMQTIFMFSVIALYIVHRRVVINMVVGVYYIVIIKFIDFATKICLLLYYITWGMYIVWSTVVQWPMRKKSRKPWVIKVDLWFMKTLMIIGMLGYRCYVTRCSILFRTHILHFAAICLLQCDHPRFICLILNNPKGIFRFNHEKY